MGSINLTLRFSHPSAISNSVRYARIDNIQIPTWVNVSPNPTTSPATIATNIDNAQYLIESTPVYADGRLCLATQVYTAGCEGLVSINAYIQSENLVIQYLAPSSVPKVRITVDYPNGGSYVANYVNSASNIVIALPTGVNGDFFIQGQSVCDEDSQFYSVFSNPVTVTRNSNPTITQSGTSNTGAGGTRTQIFTIGPTVTSGNRYTLTVYSHIVEVVANVGDTAGSIAVKLANAINATTESQWNDMGSAPVTGTVGFPPTASASGVQVIVVLNYSNQFSASAFVS